MMKRSKYTKIPDAAPKVVNDEEEDFPVPQLGTLDLEETATDIFDFFKGLLLAVISPLVTLVINLWGAFLTKSLESDLAILLYPYAVAVVTFVGAVPVIIGSFNPPKSVIFPTTDALLSMVEGSIDSYEEKVLNLVVKLKSQVENGLKSFKPKLDKMTILEKKLKKVDPNIDIPDSSDLEAALEKLEDQVRDIFVLLRSELDLKGLIPKPAQSPFFFNLYIVCPVLILYLIIELFLATKGNVSTNEKAVRYLRGAVITPPTTMEVVDEIPVVTRPTMMEVIDEIPDDMKKVALSCFYAALNTTLITFLATLKSFVQSLINCKVESLKREVEAKLEMVKDEIKERTTRVEDMFEKLKGKIEEVESKLPPGFR